MAEKTSPRDKPVKAQSRDDRLKAALKANLARRKAQARARSAEQGAGAPPKNENDED